MARVCVFDVNETLLNLDGLDPLFARSFGNGPAARGEWFTQMIQNALVSIVTEHYHPFGEIGRAALAMTAARRGVMLTDEERDAILHGIRTLEPHADVHDCLRHLRAAGLRLAALTNSTLVVAEAQLTHAGIRDYFEHVISADEARRLKPAPEPYRLAAERLGVAIGEVRLIAAHAWDVAGALHAGCAAAFVARKGLEYDPLAPQPDIVALDLRDAAEQIARVETGH